MPPIWTGVFPAVTTHFHDDERVDLAATVGHVRALLDAGVGGLVMLGTVGENCSLDREEKVEVLRATCAAVGSRVPVIAGIAECTTRGACRAAEDARAAGCHGLMVLPPMVYTSDDRETREHILSTARAGGLPVMVYNNPVSYRVDIAPAAFAAYADEPLVVAIKESSDDPRRIVEIRRRFKDRFALFCGVDNLVLESYLAGIDGWISGLVDAFPRENAALWSLLNAGRFEEARAIYEWYAPLLHLDTLPKLVQYIKLAMSQTGLGAERCRAPRRAIEGEERERVLGIIREAIRTRPDLARFARGAGR